MTFEPVSIAMRFFGQPEIPFPDPVVERGSLTETMPQSICLTNPLNLI